MPSRNRRHSGRSEADRAEQAREALRLRREGLPTHAIAERLSVSPRTAERRVRAALNAMTEETAEDLRRVIEDRLDAVLRGVWAVIRDQESSTANRLRAYDLILRADQQRARLLGLCVPPAIVVSLEREEWNRDAPA